MLFEFLTDAQAMLQNDIHNSVFLPAIPAQRPKALPPCWDRNIKLLPGISSISYTKVPTWTPKQVADFLLVLVPSLSSSQKRLFIDQVRYYVFLGYVGCRL